MLVSITARIKNILCLKVGFQSALVFYFYIYKKIKACNFVFLEQSNWTLVYLLVLIEVIISVILIKDYHSTLQK